MKGEKEWEIANVNSSRLRVCTMRVHSTLCFKHDSKLFCVMMKFTAKLMRLIGQRRLMGSCLRRKSWLEQHQTY